MEGRPLPSHEHWSGGLCSHLAFFPPPKITSRCLRSLQEPDTCSFRRPTPPATICVSHGPVSRPLRAPWFFWDGWNAKGWRLGLCGQLLRSASLIDRCASAPVHLSLHSAHFLGFSACIFHREVRAGDQTAHLGSSCRGPYVPDRPHSSSLQKDGRPPLSERHWLGSRSHAMISLAFIEQPRTGCDSQSKLGH